LHENGRWSTVVVVVVPLSKQAVVSRGILVFVVGDVSELGWDARNVMHDRWKDGEQMWIRVWSAG